MNKTANENDIEVEAAFAVVHALGWLKKSRSDLKVKDSMVSVMKIQDGFHVVVGAKGTSGGYETFEFKVEGETVTPLHTS